MQRQIYEILLYRLTSASLFCKLFEPILPKNTDKANF